MFPTGSGWASRLRTRFLPSTIIVGCQNRRKETLLRPGASQPCSSAAVLLQLSGSGPQFANWSILLVFSSGDVSIVQLCGRINCMNLGSLEGTFKDFFVYESLYLNEPSFQHFIKAFSFRKKVIFGGESLLNCNLRNATVWVFIFDYSLCINLETPLPLLCLRKACC